MKRCSRRLLGCLALFFVTQGIQEPAVCDPSSEAPNDDQDLIRKWKECTHLFIDCCIDQLHAFCSTETALNFECFRTIGDCIPKTLRKVLSFEKEEKQESDEEEDNAVPDEL